MKGEEFNGYSFDDKNTRKRMKYLVVKNGDLDLNGAYGFKSKRELNEYLKSIYYVGEVLAVFEIKDITS